MVDESICTPCDENTLNCLYCAGKKLCDKENCQKCFNSSFASHEKAQYWSDKNELKPKNIAKFSNK